MVEQGVRDFRLAKDKAADRHGVTDRGALPGNAEIEAAITENRRIFAGSAHDALLDSLRKTAVRAMELLSEHEPRLVGSVLSGAVTPNSDINLHVFADSAETIAMSLMQKNVPYDAAERRVKLAGGDYEWKPVFRFIAGDARIDVTVFPEIGLRSAPLSPVDGKPMRRANCAEVGELAG